MDDVKNDVKKVLGRLYSVAIDTSCRRCSFRMEPKLCGVLPIVCQAPHFPPMESPRLTFHPKTFKCKECGVKDTVTASRGGWVTCDHCQRSTIDLSLADTLILARRLGMLNNVWEYEWDGYVLKILRKKFE